MAGIVTVCLVGDELGMVDRYEPSLDHFFGHLMTTLTVRLNQPAVSLAALEKMACKADFLVYVEVLVSLDVTVTQTAGDFDTVDDVFNVDLVGSQPLPCAPVAVPVP